MSLHDTSRPPEYWDDLYIRQETAWDMGHISPPLQAYFEQLTNKDISILIPGCGNSHEAEWLLQNHFTNITLLDISPVLINTIRKKFKTITDPPLHLVTANFFDYTGQFDLIVEQTFFCALEPPLRENYIDKMHALLKPTGKLVGLLFDRTFPEGGPFGGSREEYKKLLEKKFDLKTLEPCYNSVKPRAGTELFFIAKPNHTRTKPQVPAD